MDISVFNKYFKNDVKKSGIVIKKPTVVFTKKSFI